jgi:arylsulfatase A-like enzyme
MKTLLITVDALRADHLSQYGYDLDTMPVLDRLMSEGTLFEAAYSNGPYTRISVPSFHTSDYLAYENLADLSPISEILGNEGAQTACIGTQTGFVGTGEYAFDEYIDLGRDEYHDRSKAEQSTTENLFSRVGNWGRKTVGTRLKTVSAPAYERIKSTYQRLAPGSGFTHAGYTSAEDLTDAAIEWLDENHDEDFFLWLHYMEGHRPYGVHDTDPAFLDEQVSEDRIRNLMEKAGTQPESMSVGEHRLLESMYDSDLRYCSRHLDRLFDELEDQGLWEETDIVFTSDHGEEFYEHGEYFHRNLPYDELLHVPLVLKSHRDESVVSERRELLDVAPTICELHGLDTEELPFGGQHLFEGDPRRVIAVGTQMAHSGVVADRWDGWKYIYTEDEQFLFDLDSDPREQFSVADEYPDVVERFREEIPEPIFTRSPEQLRDPTDDVDRGRLEALGYIEVKE